jgi:hypothetical protein
VYKRNDRTVVIFLLQGHGHNCNTYQNLFIAYVTCKNWALVASIPVEAFLGVTKKAFLKYLDEIRKSVSQNETRKKVHINHIYMFSNNYVSRYSHHVSANSVFYIFIYGES